MARAKRSIQPSPDQEPVAKKVRESEAPQSPEHKKPNIPVDEECKNGSTFEVHVDEEEVIWDASLNLTVSSYNNNKFYRIQLLKSKTNTSEHAYATWTRWGRVGEKGAGALIDSRTFEDAKKIFEKKFREKSGLRWTDRLSPPKDGKYTFLERDYEDNDDDNANGQDDSTLTVKKEETDELSLPQCTLSEPVREVVELIFDQRDVQRALKELNFDANKLPLGKLSKRTLKSGFEILKELSELMDDQSLAKKKYEAPYFRALELLSNRYFTIIPHAFGRNAPPVIKNQHVLKGEVYLLENLMDMEISNQIFRNSFVDTKIHHLDVQYQGLGLDEMTPLSRETTEFTELQNYLAQDLFGNSVQEIFRIERKGEFEQFKSAGFTKSSNDNRRLLWHGSRTTNFGGILSQGLRIAPPEAPVSGYMFGKGVYFADVSKKSAGYCHSPHVGLLLLCEVQLGNPMHELQNGNYMAGEDAKAAGKLATLGLGRRIPQGWKDAGCVHPSLKGVLMPDMSGGLEEAEARKSCCLYHNEYIVYDIAQIRQRYLVKVNLNRNVGLH